WREALADLPVLELPGDRVRPAVQGTTGSRLTRPLPADLSRAVHELGRRLGVTPFAVLLAAFDLLLSRYTGGTDVVVGSPVAGRNRTEIEGQVGLFVNTLVLRAEVAPDLAFADLLRRVQQGVLDALSHQDVPFETLVDELRPERTLSHSPLTPVLFAFQNVPMAPARFADIALTPFDFERTTARFDLCLFVVDTGREFVLAAEYSRDLFAEPTIAHMLRAFECLLARAVAEPNRRVRELPLVPVAERGQAIENWNRTATDYPRNRTVAELFEAQVAVRPDAVALVAGDRRRTYRELNEDANRMARHLEALGVDANALVGLCLERSIEMIVAMLAIVKAGGAYVPLDPAYPDARLVQMLDGCGASVVITTDELRARLDRSAAACVCLPLRADVLSSLPSADAAPRCVPTDRAYVMFTSGSTGVPKGVEVVHRGITRLLFGVDYVTLGPDETILQLAPFSFDAATFEIWGALLHGGRLVLYPDRVATPRELGDVLRAHCVTTMWLTGSLYNVVIDEAPEVLASLRQLLIGGDALSVPHVRRGLESLPGVQLVNGYGPTESTTFACCEPIARDLPADARSIPIGRPIGNTRVYLLDPSMNLVPVGAPGELHIGGDGLARGYLGSPSLTAEKFVADPFRPGERIYRTGDLARYLPDGRIEFLGRLDQQVKIRGYRIECGEIEAALVAHAGVREAAVVPVHEAGGRKRLVAYVVSEPGQDPSVHELRRRLLDRLPDYMVPSGFVFLASLPLNRNGKVDRAALPDPASARFDVQAEGRQQPRNDREAILARVWAQVLRLDEVGVHDNFFELGGDSILSIQIVARANDAGLALRPKDVFRHQTIAELAEAAQLRPRVSAEQGPVTGEATLTPIQRWFFELNAANPDHFNQAIVLDVESDIDPVVLGEAVAAVVGHHDALRLRFSAVAGDWRGVIGPVVAGSPLDVIDLECSALDAAAEVERAGNALNERLTLDGGLARFTLLRFGGGGRARLICVVHHLAVDGVSWRVLLDDLQTAYTQRRRGDALRLPAKTTSWLDWGERKAAACTDAAGEFDFWLDATRAPVLAVPAPAIEGRHTIGEADRLSTSLSAQETTTLLQEVPGAFHTQINEVLLTAFALALRDWVGPGDLLIDLEGHGREAIFDDVDLSRTVGWFTSLYPVRLALPAGGHALQALKQTKENLRAIPRHGIGYGLLRYASDDRAVRDRLAAAPSAAIGFNYLGQFDQVFQNADGWRFAAEGPGRVWDSRTPRTHWLDVSAAVVHGALRVEWTFCPAAHPRDAIDRLASAFVEALRELTRVCTAPGAGGWTPSDFPLAHLNQSSLDALHACYPEMVDLYPLSPLQHGMLFHAVDGSSGGAYVEQLSCRIEAPFDPAVFQTAWSQTIERHPVLRTVFEWQEVDRPLQVVLRRVAPSWSIEDWRDVPADARAAELSAWLTADAARGFVLSDPPLHRFALLRLDDDSWRFVWSFHHILLDGWCLPILLRDVASAYASMCTGVRVDAARHEPYRDYIAWLQSQDAAPAETFWRDTLAGLRAATPLPADRTANGWGECRLQLSEDATASLQALARREQVTTSTVVQAAWAVLLARASGEGDVVFGITMSGRPAGLRGVETMIGLFISTLPLRVTVDWSEPLLPWLKRVQASQVAVREHEHVGLADVQRWADMPAGHPLFETLVVFENYPIDTKAPAPGAGALRTRDFHVRERTNFPLTLVASPGNRLSLKLLYDGVAPAIAGRLIASVEHLLTEIASEQPPTLGDIKLVSDAERGEVVGLGAGAWSAPMPAAQCIGLLFDAQAAARPEAEAVRCGAEALSYSQLHQRSNQWAHLLRRHGVGPETVVGVCLDGGIELITVLLGIVKAGGAYMALDPTYPSPRLEWMVRETETPIVVTDSQLRARVFALRDMRVLEADIVASDLAREPKTSPAVNIGGDHLAYVSYTSGSTGQPKGVGVPHRAVVRLMFGVDYATFGPAETWLQLAPVGFDASTLEIWGALLHGGRLVVTADRVPTPQNLGALLQAERVTAMWLTASLYNAVIDAAPEAIAGIRQLIIGGEALSVAHVQRGIGSLPATQIVNGYGPTEGTTFTCCFPIPRDYSAGRSIPIGRPIGRTRVYILDQTGAPVPVGVPGELYIGGDGLGRGYLRQPARTAERFVPDAVSGIAGARLYRTGDVVRWTPDGVIEFVGRRDAQVKVRGFRVEPGEIETVLGAHPSVRSAAVVAREDTPGVKRLVAYVVASGDGVDEDDLRAFLKARLPEYMVPAMFVVMADLPRTPNGKLDRAMLPAPTIARSGARRGPATPAEVALAAIWTDVIGQASVGVDENFFELGGDSILSIQICARAQRAGWSVTTKQLFEHQTVAGLAAVATRRKVQGSGGETITGPVPLLPIQRWFFEQELADAHHSTQSALLIVRGVPAAIVQDAVFALLARHDALRSRFTRTPGGWTARVGAIDSSLAGVWSRVTLGGADAIEPRAAIERAAAALQSSLDLEQGPLVRAAMFDGMAEPRLLLVMHHLVVDAVSWRVLVEDLELACAQRMAGAPIVLPAKTTSVKDWGERLADWANGPALGAARAWWRNARSGGRLPVDYPASASANTIGAAASVVAELSAADTRALLQEVPKAYQTQINDVMLTALVQAAEPWTRTLTLVVDLEGHGREALFDDLDVGRTVGWFTTIAPIRLALPAGGDAGAALRAVKEQLRAVPAGGLGYSVLRYLSADTGLRESLTAAAAGAEIGFNYLGQYDGPSIDDRLFAPAPESAGPTASPRQRRRHLIEVVGLVTGGQLRLEWSYCPSIHTRPTIDALAQRCIAALRGLIAHCTTPGVGAYTPSDFPLAALGETQLDELISQVEFE
ncbi:MAG: amino acid adenylation domain-containing protein, partial [Vicinamibacterales bacterium]